MQLGGAAVWTVLGMALLARLIPFFSLVARSSATWIFGRGLETGFVAHALLTGEGFASPFGGHTGPTALISPGYVLLVTAVFRLFGDGSTASAIVIMLVQIALGVLSVWFVMQLAERLASRGAALLAGGFFALWPPLLWVPTIFWDTSLTLCLMPGLVLLALRLAERAGNAGSGRRLWVAFGALCGFAVLVNLALSLTVVAVFCWAAWNAGRRRRDVVLAALVALMIYAPWPMRNARALHAFIPLRTTVGLELWMGNRVGATGYLDEAVFPFYNAQEMREYLRRGEVGYMQDKTATAKSAIRQHPGVFASLTARRVVRFWFGTGTRGGAALYALGAALTTLCGVAGFVGLARRRTWSVACLYALPLLLFPLPYYITHAEFRYRLALDPLLAVLAAGFVAALARTQDQRSAAFAQQASAPAAEDAVAHA